LRSKTGSTMLTMELASLLMQVHLQI